MRTPSRALTVLLLFLLAGNAVADGTLRFATFGFRPYHHIYGGAASGPVVDVVRRICLQMGARCEFREHAADAARILLREGAVEGAFLVPVTTAGDPGIVFSRPLLRGEYGLFTPGDRRPRDAAELRVAVVEDSPAGSRLAGMDKAPAALALLPVRTLPAALRKLAGGEVDAVYAERRSVDSALFHMGIRGIEWTGYPAPVEYAVGFSAHRVDDELVGRFNRAWEGLVEDGFARAVLGHIGAILEP